MKNSWKIPFKDGKPLWWEGYGKTPDTEWKENFVFKARICITGFNRGCSSAKMIAEDLETQQKYEIFLNDALDIIRISDGCCVEGEFTFAKCGQNYGIKLYKAE